MTTVVKRNVNTSRLLDFLEVTRSPRDANGNLVLATNPVTRCYGTCNNPRGLDYNSLANIGDISDFHEVHVVVERNFPGLYGNCYAKFRSKVFEGAEAALAVDAAEMSETIRMIDGVVVRLIRAAKHVRRGRFSQAARVLGIRKPRKVKNLKDCTQERFAENWLAYRYGWQPLYSSIASSLEALDKPPKDHFIKASVKAERSIEDSTVSASILMKGQMVVESPTIARLNQMGVLNPLSVAWELVPFSFVADWFLPIGTYLENLTGFAGLSFKGVSTTYHAAGLRYQWYSNVSYEWIKDRKTAPHDPDWDDPGTFYQYRMKQRVVGDFPRPPLGGLHNGFNPKRLLDSITLLRSVLLGKRK